ncbi:Molybdenum cofactor guanylyltransferase [Azospirillaceae bacterium]
MTFNSSEVAAVILAGGRGVRIGGGKPAVLLAKEPLILHVWRRIQPQVDILMINGSATGPEQNISFPQQNTLWVNDALPDWQGPLSGVLGAMNRLVEIAPACRFLMTIPCDTPFLPHNLATKLWEADVRNDIIRCASSGGRIHPLIGLWPLALRDALDHAVRSEGVRKVFDWLNRRPHRVVAWPEAPIDSFLNINTPTDLAIAEAFLTRASVKALV